MSNKFKDEELKKAFGSFATGVAVASSHSNGFTINSFWSNQVLISNNIKVKKSFLTSISV